jgi:hypothetical protein
MKSACVPRWLCSQIQNKESGSQTPPADQILCSVGLLHSKHGLPHISGPALNSIRPAPGNAISGIGYMLNGSLEVTMTYSDGGSEVFKITLTTSRADFAAGVVLEGSYKPGDGESKCPE